MRYVKNFIEPKYQVLLDFDSLVVDNSTESETIPFYHKLFAVVALVFLIYSLFKTWWVPCSLLTLFFFFIAPFSFKWIQSKIGVIFPSKFIWALIAFFSVSIFVSMAVNHHIDYNHALALKKQQEEQRIAEERKLAAEKAAREEAYRIEEEKKKEMADSLEFHKKIADALYKKKSFFKALEEYKLSLNFEGNKYYPEIYKNVASIYFLQKNYREALKYYEKIGTQYGNLASDTIAYQEALCYVNVGNIRGAVNALKFAPITKRTDILFNKINPVKTKVVYKEVPVKKKKVAYYATICGDGSEYFGNSRRGACSRHGGVASWNSPVYETYEAMEKRKYYEKYREYGER